MNPNCFLLNLFAAVQNAEPIHEEKEAENYLFQAVLKPLLEGKEIKLGEVDFSRFYLHEINALSAFQEEKERRNGRVGFYGSKLRRTVHGLYQPPTVHLTD